MEGNWLGGRLCLTFGRSLFRRERNPMASTMRHEGHYHRFLFPSSDNHHNRHDPSPHELHYSKVHYKYSIQVHIEIELGYRNQRTAQDFRPYSDYLRAEMYRRFLHLIQKLAGPVLPSLAPSYHAPFE